MTWFEEMINAKLAERASRSSKSDPAIPVIREMSEVTQKYLGEILAELREQREILRDMIGRDPNDRDR
jgi:hypothetical protein